MVDRKTPTSLKPGYFLAQEASSIGHNAVFRRLSPSLKYCVDMDSTERYFEQITGKVDGLDYVNYWYDQQDGEEALKIAELARSYNIDMWAGIRLQKQFRDFPVIPAEYIAWTMAASGQIIPVLFEDRNHTIDYLNPSAVDWMLDVLEERYWKYVKGAVNGWLFPESRIPTYDVPRGRSGLCPWKLHAYSDYVLTSWKEYCNKNSIIHNEKLLNRFPVISPSMEFGCPEKCIYVPDNRPVQLPSFTRMQSIPRGTEIWIQFENFLCELFYKNYVHKISARVNSQNVNILDWRGVCYFNNDSTMLDYRNFKNASARTGPLTGNWPQGRRMGVDARMLFNDPEITCFITETVQHCADYIKYEENYISNGITMAVECNRLRDYGIMLHYIHSWGGIGNDISVPGNSIMDDLEEEERWSVIYKYQPSLLSFYSVPQVLIEGAPLYQKEASANFWKHLEQWKKMQNEKWR